MDEKLITIDDYQVMDVHYRRGPLDGEVWPEGLLEHLGIKSKPVEIRTADEVLSRATHVPTYGPVMFDGNEYYRVYWGRGQDGRVDC